jgi:hypothetical protein
LPNSNRKELVDSGEAVLEYLNLQISWPEGALDSGEAARPEGALDSGEVARPEGAAAMTSGAAARVGDDLE